MISCGQVDQVNIYTISGTSVVYQGNGGNAGDQKLCCRFLRSSNFTAYGDTDKDLFIHSYSASGFVTQNRLTSPVSNSQRRAVDWNHVTQRAYFGGSDKNLDIISKPTSLIKRVSVGKDINTVSVSNDGTYAVVGGQDGVLFIYNVVN